MMEDGTVEGDRWAKKWKGIALDLTNIRAMAAEVRSGGGTIAHLTRGAFPLQLLNESRA